MVSQAQSGQLDSLISLALKNNPSVEAHQKSIEAMKSHVVFDLADPSFLIQAPSAQFYTLGVSQDFKSPFTYGKQKRVKQANVNLKEIQTELVEMTVSLKVQQLYNTLTYYDQRSKLYQRFFELTTQLSEMAAQKYAAGESDSLEVMIASLSRLEKENFVQFSQAKLENAKAALALYCGISKEEVSIEEEGIAEIDFTSSGVHAGSARLLVKDAELELANHQYKLRKSEVFEGFSIGYMNQGAKDSPIQNRFEFGFKVPLWFWKHKKQLNIARLRVDEAELNKKTLLLDMEVEVQLLIAELIELKAQINFFENTLLIQEEAMHDMALKLFEVGESDFRSVLLVQNKLFEDQLELESLKFKYNDTIFQLEYLTQ